jgi:hypothetical protein
MAGREKFWAGLGKASVALAVLLGALQVLDRFTSPSEALEADISYGQFALPPWTDAKNLLVDTQYEDSATLRALEVVGLLGNIRPDERISKET